MSTQLNTPVTVLAQSIYQGTVESQSVAVPSGAKMVSADGLISADDSANPANAINLFAVLFSYDSQGKTFVTAATVGDTNNPGWQGVAGGNPINQQIDLSTGPNGEQVTFVKISYDIPASNPLSVGATLTFS
jgi:hypothetical protein